MANVYRANDIVEHKEYAVKILRTSSLKMRSLFVALRTNPRRLPFFLTLTS
jgi:serine/threonine-protein kinase RIO1